MRDKDHRAAYSPEPVHVPMGPPDAQALSCDHCREVISPDRMRTAVAPDSSVLHASDPSQDGWRLVRACGADHLDALIDNARAGWVVEQLWFGRLIRASQQDDSPGTSLPELARKASLSRARLRQALRWNAGRPDPTRRLPGGQAVPITDRAALAAGPAAAEVGHG